jgi:hypothetical protein
MDANQEGKETPMGQQVILFDGALAKLAPCFVGVINKREDVTHDVTLDDNVTRTLQRKYHGSYWTTMLMSILSPIPTNLHLPPTIRGRQEPKKCE